MASQNISINIGSSFNGEGMVKADEFEAKAAQIAENAMGDACTGCNPRPMDAKLMEKVLRCCWDDSEVDF